MGATSDTQSGELKSIIITDYVVPRVGDGPAPVTSLDNHYAQRRGVTTVQSVLQSLPQDVVSFIPVVNAGLSYVPGASSMNLRGLGETTRWYSLMVNDKFHPLWRKMRHPILWTLIRCPLQPSIESKSYVMEQVPLMELTQLPVW